MGHIRKRTRKDGNASFQAEVRLKGHPTLIATFDRRTDAKNWIHKVEADIRSKGMQKLYDNSDDIGMNYIKLSQETFALLCRYRGKSAQNINVTYNVLNSGNAFLKTNLVQEVTEKKGETHETEGC